MSMENALAIMAMGYNRPNSLRRLLQSLLKLKIDAQVPLLISIDAGGGQDVIDIANAFVWPYGEKEVLVHEKKLGLRDHFFFSGDITEKYENVLFVEDDLVISPESVKFADQFISKYKNEDRVAGASLYDPAYMEGLALRFYKLEDGSDVYFFQQPYWGNVWMKEKWAQFRKWYETYECRPELLPQHIAQWKKTSFKKVYIQYLIETNRYFVTPRASLATNCADPGLHIQQHTSVFQTPYALKWDDFRFIDFDESVAIYDAFFEIVPEVLKKLNPVLANYDVTVDLYGRKSQHAQYVITTMPVKKAVLTFNADYKPWELAVANNLIGDGIALAESSDFIRDEHWIKAQLAGDVAKHYGLNLGSVWILLKTVLNRKIGAAKARLRRKFGGK